MVRRRAIRGSDAEEEEEAAAAQRRQRRRPRPPRLVVRRLVARLPGGWQTLSERERSTTASEEDDPTRLGQEEPGRVNGGGGGGEGESEHLHFSDSAYEIGGEGVLPWARRQDAHPAADRDAAAITAMSACIAATACSQYSWRPRRPASPEL